MRQIAAESNINSSETPWADNEDREVVSMLKAVNIDVSDTFYERAAFNWPFVIAARYGHVGNTSLSYVLEMKDIKDDLPVAHTERTIVFVGRNSRKRVEIPVNTKEYLQWFSTKKTPLIVFPATPSSERFSLDVTVTASDTDMLYHVNQATWLKYCMDCAAEGISRGFFNHFKSDPFTYQIRNAQILYMNEGFPGDALTVSSWESSEAKDTMHFQVTRGEEQCAFCSFQFYKESIQ